MTADRIGEAAAGPPPPGVPWAPDAALIARLANALFAAGPAPAVLPEPPSLEPPSPSFEPPSLGPRSATADLEAIPHSLGGALSLVPPVVERERVRGERAALPGASLYFLDHIKVVQPLAPPVSAPAAPPVSAPDARRPFDGLDLRRLPLAPQPHATPNLGSVAGPFDPAVIRRDFPILRERIHGRPLVWLDNAATTQKPQAVIDRLAAFYEHENSNIHRGAHTLAARATDAYEEARATVRRFLGAASTNEIVFVRGATEAINLVAQAWGRARVGAGDEIVITWLEHHANIVPWQQLAAEKGARLRVAPVDDRGQIILEEYEKLLSSRTRLVALTQVANALGTVTPVHEMVASAHRVGALALVDGAQAVSHLPVDVQALGADFYVFSGHKVFGPTGIGVLYGKEALLNAMPPWQGGGNMIADVTFEQTRYQPAPARFEAGTGNIADAVGLGAALHYLERVGMATISRYEHELLGYATRGLATVPGLTVIGTAQDKAGVVSFVLDGFPSDEVGTALDQEGIAVRAGHHCAQPILRRFGLESTVRASLALYNSCDDIDALVEALWRLQSQRRAR